MFQPQPTPYASFAYGMGSGLPNYAYNQQQDLTSDTSFLEGGAGLGNLNGGVPGNSGGRYGPASGLPVAFSSSGIGVSGPRTAAAPRSSGPAGANSLLFTSPVFNNGAESGAFHSSFHASASANANANGPHHHPQQQQHHHHPSHNPRTSHHHSQGNIKMESEMAVADLAAQEAAAREYQPQLEGPLVGDRTPSHVIAEEYAKADPIYVQKTLALPQTYSHYRPIQGDGNCGWRAIGFSYFEALIRTGDASLVSAERDRLIQYPILDHMEMVYEDMREEVAFLMNDIETAMRNQGDAMAVLEQKFNDLNVANHLLYYLRLLTSSWLKGNPEANEYLGFIPEEIGILGYCQNYIELPGREIEHLGVMLLYNVLLKPCGMVIEIAYLDRTPGSAVNTYRIPDSANGRDVSTLGPIIYLLFRPDHYDILYPHPAPAAPLDIQVNRVSFPHEHHLSPNMPSLQNFTEVDMSALAMIPGLGLNPGAPSLAVPPPSSLGSLSPSPQSPWMPTPFTEPLPIRQQQTELKQEQPTPILRAVSVLPQPVQRQTPSVRFSEYCHPQLVENDTWRETCFTTSTFKNSHFNTAHYNNPNFQPEEYRPDLDDGFYEMTRPMGKRRSHS